jgi:hypothetical protein
MPCSRTGKRKYSGQLEVLTGVSGQALACAATSLVQDWVDARVKKALRYLLEANGRSCLTVAALVRQRRRGGKRKNSGENQKQREDYAEEDS